MGYKLYNRIGSAGMAIEASLQYADIDHQLIDIDSPADTPLPDRIAEINPWRQLPVLELENGDTVTETAAILIYLATAHPQSFLGPTPGSVVFARYCRWIVFLSVNIHEAVSRQLYAFRFTTELDNQQPVIDAAKQRLQQAFETLDQAINLANYPGPYITGEVLTAADIYAAMFYSWVGSDFDLPRMKELHRLISEDPKIKPVWQRHS